MDKDFTGTFIRRLSLAAIIATAGVMLTALIYVKTTGIDMGAHGWIALLVGTVISFAVSGVLTTVLVMGRRNGTDEAATEIEWE